MESIKCAEIYFLRFLPCPLFVFPFSKDLIQITCLFPFNPVTNNSFLFQMVHDSRDDCVDGRKPYSVRQVTSLSVLNLVIGRAASSIYQRKAFTHAKNMIVYLSQ